MTSRVCSALLAAATATIAVAQQPPDWNIPPGEVAKAVLRAEAAGEVTPWGIARLAAPGAWAKGLTGKGVIVAVLDTGIDASHPDLKSRIGKTASFTGEPFRDGNGHGTHCAGTIAASKDSSGVVGIAPEATLYGGKVLTDGGSGSVTGIAKGIDWAVAEGADVISMSLGGPGADSWTKPAVQRANAAGVIVVAAAGNDGPGGNTTGYPGSYPECVCVAAVDAADAVARFSSRGSPVFIAAPGVDVLSTYPGNRVATLDGTSMATPHVAGLAALWVQANPGIAKKDRPAAFKAWLAGNAKDLGPAGRDVAYGYGVTTAEKLASLTPTPLPTPQPPLEVTFTLSLADLTPEAAKKLAAAGVKDFSLKALVGCPVPPKAGAKPSPDCPDGTCPAPAGETKVMDGKTFRWRSLPGVGPGWVQEGVPDAPPAAVTPLAPAAPTCPNGRCPAPVPSGLRRTFSFTEKSLPTPAWDALKAGGVTAVRGTATAEMTGLFTARLTDVTAKLIPGYSVSVSDLWGR